MEKEMGKNKKKKQDKKKKIEILDKYGRPFRAEKLMPDNRETIAKHIFSYMTRNEEAEEFMTNAVIYMQQQGAEVKDDTISFSVDDPKFHEYSILYATKKVMDYALNEDILEAYTLLTRITESPKYRFNNGRTTTLKEKDLKELEKYYAATPELQLAKQICDIQWEINRTMSGQSGKCLTSFQANRIEEKFDAMTPYLDFEQRAAGYYNISIIHRALLAEKDYYDPEENNAEKECLKKVLEYTSDYNRINYCQNRLGQNFNNKGMIRAAYRRALTEAQTENDLYKINMALGQCYIDDYSPKSGFQQSSYGAGHSVNEEKEKLERAEMYFKDAFEYAPDPEKLSVLRKIGNLQFKQNKIPEWTETVTTLAMEYMSGEERCHTLMDVALKNKKFRQEYLERLIYEAVHSKQITSNRKAMIIGHAADYLRPIYTEKDDKQALAELQNTVQKYAPKKYDGLENPLLYYKMRKKRQK